MSDRPATQPVEPDAQVLGAIVSLLLDFRKLAAHTSLTPDELGGYALGFLLQYPSIARAETAHNLLDRCEIRLPDGALYGDVRKYLSDVEAL